MLWVVTTAGHLSGIRRARIVFLVLHYVGRLCCYSWAYAGKSLLGSQNTVGQGLELDVLAAVILAERVASGGSGTIFKLS